MRHAPASERDLDGSITRDSEAQAKAQFGRSGTPSLKTRMHHHKPLSEGATDA
jgi:hypothetical protein